MDKVKQADLQYQEAIEQLGYYREELKKRDSRIHELETLGKTFLDASTAQAARIAELESERDAAIADALVLAEYISTPILVSADGNYQENAVVDSIVEKYWNLQQNALQGQSPRSSNPT